MISVKDTEQSNLLHVFPCGRWLDDHEDDCATERTLRMIGKINHRSLDILGSDLSLGYRTVQLIAYVPLYEDNCITEHTLIITIIGCFKYKVFAP